MEVKVYYQDTDCGGVVYYANYLTYFERARTEWLEERGVSLKKLADEGTLFVISHAELDYKSPARYAETLVVHTQPGKAGSVRFDLQNRIEEKSTGRLIVTGLVTVVCVGNDFKPKQIPEEVRKALTEGICGK